MTDAAAQLARAVVLWDGASEDGCTFCGGEYGESRAILHGRTCPVVVHRLELIAALVETDPPADSAEGRRLTDLAKVQARYERAVFGSAEETPP